MLSDGETVLYELHARAGLSVLTVESPAGSCAYPVAFDALMIRSVQSLDRVMQYIMAF